MKTIYGLIAGILIGAGAMSVLQAGPGKYQAPPKVGKPVLFRFDDLQTCESEYSDRLRQLDAFIQKDNFYTICENVVRCDKEFSTIPDSINHCKSFFVQLRGKFPETIIPVSECILSSPCESFSFMQCGEDHLQELKGLLP